MAYTFPLSLANFLDRLPLDEVTFEIPFMGEGDETNGGDVWVIANGVSLWEGEVQLAQSTHTKIDALWGLAQMLSRAGTSFLICPVPRIGPVNDHLGTRLGSAAPTITTVSATMRDVTISGLPANYSGLEAGSYLSFTYGSGPKYALHQIVNGGNANASGVITVEVTPPIRSGFTLPMAVTLKKPVLKAVMKVGSLKAPRLKIDRSSGFSFAWRQTLK